MDKKNVNVSEIQEYHSIILNILNIIINQKTTWFKYKIQLKLCNEQVFKKSTSELTEWLKF